MVHGSRKNKTTSTCENIAKIPYFKEVTQLEIYESQLRTSGSLLCESKSHIKNELNLFVVVSISYESLITISKRNYAKRRQSKRTEKMCIIR